MRHNHVLLVLSFFCAIQFSCLRAASQIPDTIEWSEAELQSMDAEVALRAAGATSSEVSAFYIGGRPELPILDKDGTIHPSSCNPHFAFPDSRFNKHQLESLMGHLKKLHPGRNSSHVGIYLGQKIFRDEALMKQIRASLPKCRIYEYNGTEIIYPRKKPSSKTRQIDWKCKMVCGDPPRPELAM